MAGHEEEDIWMHLEAGGVADVTECLDVTHDVQRPSLVDQSGVQSCEQVAH